MPNILYLHGAGASLNSFNYIGGKLPDHQAYHADYDCLFCGLEDNLQMIAEKVDDTFQGQPYSVLGHSLGGIIGVLLYARGQPVERIMTLSTPFGGSEAAYLFRLIFLNVHLYSDVHPHSRYIREVLSTPIAVPALCMVSTGGSSPLLGRANDGVVTVASQIALSGPEYRFVNLNHTEVLLSPEVIEAARTFLFAGA